MIELDLPRFAYRLETGVLALRDGFVVVFYLPSAHSAVAGSVQAAVELYLDLPDVPEPLWLVDEEGTPVDRRTAALRAAIAADLDAVHEEVDLHIVDSPADAPGFSVRYHGLDLGRRASEGWPNAVSAIRFTFPTDYGGTGGLLEIFNFANELAERLSFSFGYVSPAFVYLEGTGEPGAFPVIRSLSRRYRCFDIPALLLDCFEVGDGPKGAFWGTYFGPRMAAHLGGESALRGRLAPYELKYQRHGGGARSLYLGPVPVAGDVNRQEDVEVYEALFHVLAPDLRPRRVAYMDFDDEAMRDWLYRFGDSVRDE